MVLDLAQKFCFKMLGIIWNQQHDSAGSRYWTAPGGQASTSDQMIREHHGVRWLVALAGWLSVAFIVYLVGGLNIYLFSLVSIKKWLVDYFSK